MWSIGVVNTKLDISSNRDLCLRFEAKWSNFFATVDSLIIPTIRSDAYLCRASHFCVNDDNNNRRTKPITLPLAHVRGVMSFYTYTCSMQYVTTISISLFQHAIIGHHMTFQMGHMDHSIPYGYTGRRGWLIKQPYGFWPSGLNHRLRARISIDLLFM